MSGATPYQWLSDPQARQAQNIYQYLHGNPELSMGEFQTAKFITAHLQTLGLDTFACGGTGVVGVLENGDGPTVAYRADMDGLPIQESTGLEFASKATGILTTGEEVPVMHGCGHDVHMTVALAAAELLAARRELWSGTVVFVFQPGEETAEGARAMVQDGLWEKAPIPQIIYGQHAWPSEAGTVNISRGPAMAMADSWKVTLQGRQAHASQPEQAIDPIVLGAHIIVRLQTIVSREIHPMAPAVVTIGTFHSGLKENIIPETAEFTLNVRSFDEELRIKTLSAIRRIIAAECAASGAPQSTIDELSFFPRCFNDLDATDSLIHAFRSTLGTERVIEVPPVMGSEDFGYLADAIGVPSVYWMLGCYTKKHLESPVSHNHSPGFRPDVGPTLTTGVQTALTAILSKVGAVHDQDEGKDSPINN